MQFIMNESALDNNNESNSILAAGSQVEIPAGDSHNSFTAEATSKDMYINYSIREQVITHKIQLR